MKNKFIVAFTLLISISVLSTSVLAEDGLVGYWKFDGNGNNEVSGGAAAAIIGGVSYKSGGQVGSYAYIPSASDWLKIPYNSSFDLQTYTISFWFRQRSDQSFAQNLVYKGNGPTNYNFYIFRQLWNQYNFGPVIAGFGSSSTGYWRQVSNPNNMTHGQWHHVVFKRDANSAAYYLDTQLIHSSSGGEYAEPTAMPHVDIIIGDTAVDTDIDDLKIYNRSLGDSEITSYYLSSGGTTTTTTTTTTSTTITTTTTTIPCSLANCTACGSLSCGAAGCIWNSVSSVCTNTTTTTSGGVTQTTSGGAGGAGPGATSVTTTTIQTTTTAAGQTTTTLFPTTIRGTAPDGYPCSTHNYCLSGYCLNSVCATPGASQTTLSLPQSQICTDSDKGISVSERGVVVGIDGSISEDSCAENNLTEYYCQGNQVLSYKTTCPNGCSDGACINTFAKLLQDLINLIKRIFGVAP
ncbi:MAG: LamG domain-containing protein [Candidatus Aenigmarchaeota archaeon]|nr:LamG domain-containing protein [Candidatus Aenigmarchaeota archaeon]